MPLGNQSGAVGDRSTTAVPLQTVRQDFDQDLAAVLAALPSLCSTFVTQFKEEKYK